jgi:hypothetical protein
MSGRRLFLLLSLLTCISFYIFYTTQLCLNRGAGQPSGLQLGACGLGLNSLKNFRQLAT